jgi:hypothetical protein
LLDAFRQGWMTPPISVGKGPPERNPVMTIDELLSNLQRDRAGAKRHAAVERAARIEHILSFFKHGNVAREMP